MTRTLIKRLIRIRSYIAEIYPNHLRSAGVALGLASFYLASEVTLIAAPIAMNSISWKLYLVFIVPSAFYIPVIYFFFPETKGRTLEEIGALFGDTHIANQSYGVTEEEKRRIHEQALNASGSGKYDDENVLPKKVNLEEIELHISRTSLPDDVNVRSQKSCKG